MRKKHQPGCPCCPTPVFDCGFCNPDTNPYQYQVVIAGMTTSVSACCPDLNGTFVLTQNPSIPCQYRLVLSPSICLVTSIELLISGDNTQVILVRSGIPAATYRQTGMANPRDCDHSGLSLPINVGLSACGSGSTCHITAL